MSIKMVSVGLQIPDSLVIDLHTREKVVCLVPHSSTQNTVLSAEDVSNRPSKRWAEFAVYVISL